MPRSAATVDLGVVVHGEGDHAVDVGRRDAGVVERGLHRFDRETQLAAPRVLRELGRTDAGDSAVCRGEMAHRHLQRDGAGDVVAEVVGAAHLDRDDLAVDRR